MAAQELARWTRFAAKGGVGRCTATVDCVAREIGDLMFLKVSAVKYSDSFSCCVLAVWLRVQWSPVSAKSQDNHGRDMMQSRIPREWDRKGTPL
jgi:hypothetical protein